jgi:YD repeat-containing protein
VNLPGAGEEISRVAFDWAVTLLTAEGSELRVEGPFDLTVDGSTTQGVDPSHVAPHAASLVRQLRRRVTAVRVLDGGGLELRIDGDFSMLVHPGHEFEAWTYNGSDDSKAVGMPDGDVETWA